MPARPLVLGRIRAATDGVPEPSALPSALPYALPAHHLVTHGVVVGMTGSGKTGLCMVLVEEALRARVPVLMVDVKGDLPNLLLTFPTLAPEAFLPWIDADAARRDGSTPDARAAEACARWTVGLAQWDLGAGDVAALRDCMDARVITPGTRAGEALHVLSALEHPSDVWNTDEEIARESLAATLSLLLRLIDHDGDAARSREHVLLALLAERRLRAGRGAGLEALVADLAAPPVERVGALALDDFMPASARAGLAQDLNTLIASPTFATWRTGAALDVGAWLTPRGGKTPAVILSVAHLDDAERTLVLSLVLEQVLAWVRGLPGTSDLRALVLFDEVFGFLPPHPAAPPTKRPLLALLKQARAFGVGVVVATQNPMDLDYKALSNAGLWFVGRLQTDADRERVVEGLAGSTAHADSMQPAALAGVLKSLPARTFYVRNVHDVHDPERPGGAALLETRWSLAWLRGPMTRQEIRRLVGRPDRPADPAPAPAATPALPQTREMPAVVIESPALPAGWKTWHGPIPVALPGAPDGRAWRYHPSVGARVAVHFRDVRAGVQHTEVLQFVAAFDPDGRADLARSWPIDLAAYDAPPQPGAAHAPLPATLHRKGGAAAIEKQVREGVYRGHQRRVHVHRRFGLTSALDEPLAAFRQRCEAEARRRAQADEDAVRARHAPRIERLRGRIDAARRDLTDADAPGAVLSAVASGIVDGVLGGRSGRVRVRLDQQTARRERARAALARAAAALDDARAKLAADLAAVTARVASAADAIETKTLAAKRSDIEVIEVGVAWVPGAA